MPAVVLVAQSPSAWVRYPALSDAKRQLRGRVDAGALGHDSPRMVVHQYLDEASSRYGIQCTIGQNTAQTASGVNPLPFSEDLNLQFQRDIKPFLDALANQFNEGQIVAGAGVSAEVDQEISMNGRHLHGAKAKAL